MISALRSFARLLGLRDDQAEDALVSERAARAVLTRRDFFAASAALASAKAFSFGAPVSTYESRIADYPFFFGVERAGGAKRLSGIRFDEDMVVRWNTALKLVFAPDRVFAIYKGGEPYEIGTVIQSGAQPNA